MVGFFICHFFITQNVCRGNTPCFSVGGYVTKKRSGKKRWIVFSSNLDFQSTYEAIKQSDLVDYYDTTGTRGKEGEGKSGLGGKLKVAMKGWDPPNIMISSKGSIECYYHEDISDIDEVMHRLPQGCAYVYPELIAVYMIEETLYQLLVPKEGEELQLALENASIEKEEFIRLSEQMYIKTNSRFRNVKHVCSCGKAYVSETWYKKHIAKCEKYDPLDPSLMATSTLVKAGKITLIGLAPQGWVTMEMVLPWEELKAAATRSKEIPIRLGHRKRARW